MNKYVFHIPHSSNHWRSPHEKTVTSHSGERKRKYGGHRYKCRHHLRHHHCRKHKDHCPSKAKRYIFTCRLMVFNLYSINLLLVLRFIIRNYKLRKNSQEFFSHYQPARCSKLFYVIFCFCLFITLWKLVIIKLAFLGLVKRRKNKPRTCKYFFVCVNAHFFYLTFFFWRYFIVFSLTIVLLICEERRDFQFIVIGSGITLIFGKNAWFHFSIVTSNSCHGHWFAYFFNLLFKYVHHFCLLSVVIREMLLFLIVFW